MQELMRLQNINKRGKYGRELRDYNLNIRRGEILYILGISGSGKSTLENILTGRDMDFKGNVYFEGRKLNGKDVGTILQKEVYDIGNQMPLAEKMSVMDNLQAIRRVRFALRPYLIGQARHQTKEILEQYKIPASPEKKVQELHFADIQKLCIVKLIRSGVKLIIINCAQNSYSERDELVLGSFIKQFCDRGISFLILAEKLNKFLKVADRVQAMQHGTDIMEWRAEEFEKSTFQSELITPWENRVETGDEKSERLTCLVDFDWERSQGTETFLRTFREQNPETWEKYVNIAIPKNGEIRKGKDTVIIPQESGELLPDNLSLEDNLIICAKERLGIGRPRFIHAKMRSVLTRDFLKLINRDGYIRQIQELSQVERKILSIYRWEFFRPRAFFLEDPFWGLDLEDTGILNNYLKSLKEKNIKVVIFTRYLEQMADCYDTVIYSRDAKEPVVQDG